MRKGQKMPPATLDINGAAEMMKMHPNSVLKLIKGGVLPAARIGRAYVLLTRDVLALIEQQIIAQTAERMQVPGRRVRHTNLLPRKKR